MFNLSPLLELAKPAPVGPELCYKDLNVVVSSKLLGQAINAVNTINFDDWLRSDDRTFWQLHLEPQKVKGLDNLLDTMLKEFKVPGISLLYIQPWTYIRPHTDQYRKCAINALLTLSPSTTFWLTGLRRPDQEHILELDAKLYNYYAVNTTITHGVINRQHPRLMLTIDIPSVEYKDLVNFFK